MGYVILQLGNVVRVSEGSEQQLDDLQPIETVTVQEQTSGGNARLEHAWKEADEILRRVRARKARHRPNG